MLKYKAVSVERLICICDRCGRVTDKETDMMDWQERFVISCRAGYGSVFGDGNFVEGDFFQECIQSVLGKWLRVTDDDPFDSKHNPVNEAEKILQNYQFDRLQESRRRQAEFTNAIKEGNTLREKRLKLAEQLGVSEEQVVGLAFDYLMESTSKELVANETPQQAAAKPD